MTDCLCCTDEGLQEKVIPWLDLGEHGKDQVNLMIKTLPAVSIVFAAVGYINYRLWKKN